MATYKDALTIAAGVLFVIGFLPYALAIVRGQTKPAKASWIIWASLDSITLAGMYAERTMNGQILGAVTGAWIIVALAFKFGTPGWTKLDKLCLVGAILGIALWLLFNSPTLGMSISLFIVFLGAIPTFVSAWHDPSREDKIAWAIFWVSCVAAVLAIPSWTIADAAQPCTFFVIETTMMYLLFIRRTQNLPSKEHSVMLCKESGCDGEIDTATNITLQTGCHSVRAAHPCNKCGRVHWPTGDEVFNRPGNKVFLENGQVVHRDDKNQLVD